MQRKQYLAKNTLLFAFNSIGTRIITFLLVPLYTKAFATSDYGVIDLVTTIATLFVPIITINIGEAVMRFSLDENADKDKIINVGTLFAGLSMLSGTSIFLILLKFPQINVNGWIIYFFCITQGLYQIFACSLRGQEKLLSFAIGNIIMTLLAAVLNIVFLLVFKWGINGYFLSYIVSYVVAGGYCFVVGNIPSTFMKFTIDKLLMKQMVKYSIVLVPNSLMWWVMNSSDHIMVITMINTAANGIYAISYKLPSILAALSSVFNQAWSYSAIHEDKSDDREAFSNKMFDKLVRFNLLINVALMCIMKPLMRVYVEDAYFEAWMYTPYLLTGNFFLTISTFLSTSYTVNKDNKGFLFSGSTGALMNIALNFLLIPIIGLHGAALATCISYITVFIYRVADTRKYIHIHVFKNEYVICYILMILTAISMVIPGWIGQSILIIEVLVMIMLNYKFFFELLQMGGTIMKKVIRKSE